MTETLHQHRGPADADVWTWSYRNLALFGDLPMLTLDSDDAPELTLMLPSDDGGMRMWLWPLTEAVPDIPHTSISPTFAVHGDILVGDISAIGDNPMTYFNRVETGLDQTKTTALFSAQNGAKDTDGGAHIAYAPANNSGGSVIDGQGTLVAYGLGTDRWANGWGISQRSDVDTASPPS